MNELIKLLLAILAAALDGCLDIALVQELLVVEILGEALEIGPNSVAVGPAYLEECPVVEGEHVLAV